MNILQVCFIVFLEDVVDGLVLFQLLQNNPRNKVTVCWILLNDMFIKIFSAFSRYPLMGSYSVKYTIFQQLCLFFRHDLMSFWPRLNWAFRPSSHHNTFFMVILVIIFFIWMMRVREKFFGTRLLDHWAAWATPKLTLRPVTTHCIC